MPRISREAQGTGAAGECFGRLSLWVLSLGQARESTSPRGRESPHTINQRLQGAYKLAEQRKVSRRRARKPASNKTSACKAHQQMSEAKKSTSPAGAGCYWFSGSGLLFEAASPGRRLLSSNQVPRSISLQRSLQKGRQRCCSVQATAFLQVGQCTVLTGDAGLFTGFSLPR